MTIKLKASIAALTSTILLAACGSGSHTLLPVVPAALSIVETAKADPATFSSLVAALAFASDNNDLVDTLSKAGTYTVFAPTNAAFDKLAVELLGAGKTATDLLVPTNKALVKSVLQAHVLGATVLAAQVPIGKAIDPILAGSSDVFFVEQAGTALTINDGRNRKTGIVKTDVTANNGVIHVLDRVLLPANKTIVETAQGVNDFTTLVSAVLAADLAPTLSGAGPFTVFAPTNAAFAAALTELNITAPALLANKPLLAKVLTYHVVPGRVLKADVPVGTPIATVQGETFTVDSTLAITDQRGRKANITATNVLTSNGVVHIIDKVILPKP